jgi:hypothetical protein
LVEQHFPSPARKLGFVVSLSSVLEKLNAILKDLGVREVEVSHGFLRAQGAYIPWRHKSKNCL